MKPLLGACAFILICIAHLPYLFMCAVRHRKVIAQTSRFFETGVLPCQIHHPKYIPDFVAPNVIKVGNEIFAVSEIKISRNPLIPIIEEAFVSFHSVSPTDTSGDTNNSRFQINGLHSVQWVFDTGRSFEENLLSFAHHLKD